jgi:hypothetical protein
MSLKEEKSSLKADINASSSISTRMSELETIFLQVDNFAKAKDNFLLDNRKERVEIKRLQKVTPYYTEFTIDVLLKANENINTFGSPVGPDDSDKLKQSIEELLVQNESINEAEMKSKLYHQITRIETLTRSVSEMEEDPQLFNPDRFFTIKNISITAISATAAVAVGVMLVPTTTFFSFLGTAAGSLPWNVACRVFTVIRTTRKADTIEEALEILWRTGINESLDFGMSVLVNPLFMKFGVLGGAGDHYCRVLTGRIVMRMGANGISASMNQIKMAKTPKELAYDKKKEDYQKLQKEKAELYKQNFFMRYGVMPDTDSFSADMHQIKMHYALVEKNYPKATMVVSFAFAAFMTQVGLKTITGSTLGLVDQLPVAKYIFQIVKKDSVSETFVNFLNMNFLIPWILPKLEEMIPIKNMILKRLKALSPSDLLTMDKMLTRTFTIRTLFFSFFYYFTEAGLGITTQEIIMGGLNTNYADLGVKFKSQMNMFLSKSSDVHQAVKDLMENTEKDALQATIDAGVNDAKIKDEAAEQRKTYKHFLLNQRASKAVERESKAARVEALAAIDKKKANDAAVKKESADNRLARREAELKKKANTAEVKKTSLDERLARREAEHKKMAEKARLDAIKTVEEAERMARKAEEEARKAEEEARKAEEVRIDKLNEADFHRKVAASAAFEKQKLNIKNLQDQLDDTVSNLNGKLADYKNEINRLNAEVDTFNQMNAELSRIDQGMLNDQERAIFKMESARIEKESDTRLGKIDEYHSESLDITSYIHTVHQFTDLPEIHGAFSGWLNDKYTTLLAGNTFTDVKPLSEGKISGGLADLANAAALKKAVFETLPEDFKNTDVHNIAPAKLQAIGDFFKQAEKDQTKLSTDSEHLKNYGEVVNAITTDRREKKDLLSDISALQKQADTASKTITETQKKLAQNPSLEIPLIALPPINHLENKVKDLQNKALKDFQAYRDSRLMASISSEDLTPASRKLFEQMKTREEIDIGISRYQALKDADQGLNGSRQDVSTARSIGNTIKAAELRKAVANKDLTEALGILGKTADILDNDIEQVQKALNAFRNGSFKNFTPTQLPKEVKNTIYAAKARFMDTLVLEQAKNKPAAETAEKTGEELFLEETVRLNAITNNLVEKLQEHITNPDILKLINKEKEVTQEEITKLQVHMQESLNNILTTVPDVHKDLTRLAFELPAESPHLMNMNLGTTYGKVLLNADIKVESILIGSLTAPLTSMFGWAGTAVNAGISLFNTAKDVKETLVETVGADGLNSKVFNYIGRDIEYNKNVRADEALLSPSQNINLPKLLMKLALANEGSKQAGYTYIEELKNVASYSGLNPIKYYKLLSGMQSVVDRMVLNDLSLLTVITGDNSDPGRILKEMDYKDMTLSGWRLLPGATKDFTDKELMTAWLRTNAKSIFYELKKENPGDFKPEQEKILAFVSRYLLESREMTNKDVPLDLIKKYT